MAEKKKKKVCLHKASTSVNKGTGKKALKQLVCDECKKVLRSENAVPSVKKEV